MNHFAVVDVETTGLSVNYHHRIVEIAIVFLDRHFTPLSKFCTLINPERDIGPVSIHKIHPRDVIDAPKFKEVAPTLLELLNGTQVLVGHNLRFDESFLTSEFERVGVSLPHYRKFCTMTHLGGGKLSACCEVLGIDVGDDSHRALNDADATTKLFIEILKNDSELHNDLSQICDVNWPQIPHCQCNFKTRIDSTVSVDSDESYIQRLVKKMNFNATSPEIGDIRRKKEDAIYYIALLDRCLEDRTIDEKELHDLQQCTVDGGFNQEDLEILHRDYIRRIIALACSGGTLSESELNDINSIAHIIGGVPDSFIKTCLVDFLSKEFQDIDDINQRFNHILPRTIVCFTGQSEVSICGQLSNDRECAKRIIEEKGLIFTDSLTKKVGILVVSDPFTQSSKAVKARKYGIRIIEERVFWRKIGVDID